MKKYTLTAAEALKHVPESPDRTAKRATSSVGMNFDMIFQTWPSRASMAKSIRMQQKREHRSTDWIPCIKLTDGEGY